ncbi:hypothetical protein [Selenomonas ruminis]|uniref:Uncharacterized protein n=1 Tax=Selenomonas ruminis TaxID=2593411 RepID=A0A5D6WES3_9FIRM|nr:hypothetical protein [Selenomonas sp. mPRGC5]TYZ24934.1 hypothetical protein FZ040_02540 [Selenomonas sp. mPRGC5]
MSVLARMRKLSQYEFYVNALKLRKSMRFLLLRDLGIKDKVREVHEFTKDMSEDDRVEFIILASKYNMEKFSTEYPQWVIEKLRNAIWEHLDQMIDHITYAYSVWPTSKAEYDHRRVEMDKAISSCECLKKDLEGAIDILPVNVEKYISYVEKIDKEIALIKGWRKADNKRFKDLK